MIKRTGDLFTTTNVAIGHGVNTFGVMGAGIAEQVRNKFPKNYTQYRQSCGYGALTAGGVLIIKEKGYVIVNLATQDRPGPNANYKWVFDSTNLAAQLLQKKGINMLSIPMIGAGIGGLEWEKVEALLVAVELLNPGFEFEVWKYDR